MLFSAARLFMFSLAILALAGAGRALAAASPAPDASAASNANGPQSYAQFVKDAQVQSGLFPIITKADKIYLAIGASQLDHQFIEPSGPSTGLGGNGPAPGEPYVAPARMIEFSKVSGKIIMFWPN